jgi:hypothetical protein
VLQEMIPSIRCTPGITWREQIVNQDLFPKKKKIDALVRLYFYAFRLNSLKIDDEACNGRLNHFDECFFSMESFDNTVCLVSFFCFFWLKKVCS